MDSDHRYLVYKHTGPTGKSYIGITNNYDRRCQEHKRRNNLFAFQRALLKYGWDAFEHTVLAEGLTREEACSVEQEYIQSLNTIVPHGYNQTRGGNLPAYHTRENIDRFTQSAAATLLERYGVSNPGQLPQSRAAASKRMNERNPGIYSEECVDKRRQSKHASDCALTPLERQQKYGRVDGARYLIEYQKSVPLEVRQERAAWFDYIAIDPLGGHHSFISLKAFCMEHGLNADIFRKHANTGLPIPKVTSGPNRPTRIQSVGWTVWKTSRKD